MSDNDSKVAEIRSQIDTLDNKIHDLLMNRAEMVLKIGEEKRRSGVQVIQPDREIVMIRRLLARHKGPLPKEAVVRIWRELVGAVSLLQTGLKVAVTVPEGQNSLLYWDMAKDYFSSVLPMQRVNNAMGVLAMVREGESTFGVLPWPADQEEKSWWRYLLNDDSSKPMRIVARLPLGNRKRTDENPEHRALVVARLEFCESGLDRSFIALEAGQDISRARLADKAREIGHEPLGLFSARGRDKNTLHLLEVEGYIGPGDRKLENLLQALDCADSRIRAVGGYPVPPVYDDRVGKARP